MKDPDELADLVEKRRSQYFKAQSKLAKAIEEACPGPHVVRQHRDAKPPWCPNCGRTALGILISDLPPRIKRPARLEEPPS